MRGAVRLRACAPLPLVALCLACRALPASPRTSSATSRRRADLKYVFGVAKPVATVKPGDIIDTQDVRLLRQRHPEAGRHAREGEGRQPADRAVLRRRRGAGRHAGREDPGARRSDSNAGRRRARARVRRAQHDELHADAARAGAGEDLVLCRSIARKNEATFQRARLEVLDADPAASVPRLPRRRARRSRRAARSRRPSTAATWTRRKPAPATPPTSPSTCAARCCISATATPRWATARSPAPRSKCRCTRALQVDVIKGQKIAWPRFENAREIMARRRLPPAGRRAADRVHRADRLDPRRDDDCRSSTPTSCCRRSARSTSPRWSIPNYVVIASVDKKFLPPRKNGKPWNSDPRSPIDPIPDPRSDPDPRCALCGGGFPSSISSIGAKLDSCRTRAFEEIDRFVEPSLRPPPPSRAAGETLRRASSDPS